MVLSETEAEARLFALRRQRESIDRSITDLTLYLELGRRLTGSRTTDDEPASELGDSPAPAGLDIKSIRSRDVSTILKGRNGHSPGTSEERRSERVQSDRSNESAAEPEVPNSLMDASAVGIVPEGALARRYGRALIEAAVAVLEEGGKPLHVSEILTGLTARGFSIPGQQDPVAALNTRLWKRSGPGGPVRRLGDALYALPDAKPAP